MALLEYIQSNFQGGMNLFDQDISLGPNEYGLAFNIRNRKTSLESVKAALEDTTITAGKKQGIYAFDTYLLAFVAGRAYYRNVVTDSVWIQIENFHLDPDVDYIYCEVVPASKMNYERKLAETSQIEGSSSNNPINKTSLIINGTPAGLVVQDGKNQPWLISSAAIATRLKNYDEWTLADREYVPKMKQMKYINGILFGVAPDGKTIYRSVSGRPLDFVVNIKQNGDKGGDAETTAYSVGSDAIALLSALDTGELLVGTSKNLFPIEFNYEKTIFAEPTFLNRRSIPVGVVNQFSFISYIRDDDIPDYFFIDTDGMRYLRATKDRNEGRNSAFSLRIQSALSEKQTITAATVFNDFSYFSLSTIYGNLIAVYDNKREQWVCFDQIGDVNAVKMFAVADQSNSPTLYAITDAKLYKLQKSDDYLEASVRTKAMTNGRSNLRLEDVTTVFSGSTIATDKAYITEVVDGVDRAELSKTLTSDLIDNFYFNFQNQSKQGWKVGLKIRWSEGSELLLIGAGYSPITPQNPWRSQ
jgi:hypothetical protein